MKYAMQTEAQTMRIAMEGAFTFTDSPRFFRLLHAIQRNIEVLEIRLNLQRLESIDALALGMLLSAADAAKKKHCAFVIEQPHGQVREAISRASPFNALTVAAHV